MPARLSILVPAYNYVDGIKKIFDSVDCDAGTDLEFIISDDSSTDEIESLVGDINRRFPGFVIYRRNRPALGAVKNWNSLLELATGDFVLLLHHDEYPLQDRFVDRAIKTLGSNRDVDVVVMECMLVSLDGKQPRPHVPRWLRSAVVLKHSRYLLRRNVIGPTSCLMVRRHMYPRFEEGLKWLVDVDLYYQLRKKTGRWLMSNDLQMASVLGRKDSITASIKRNLQALEQQERLFLRSKYPEASYWIWPEKHWFAHGMERLAWAAMRGICRLSEALMHRAFDRFTAKAANNGTRQA